MAEGSVITDEMRAAIGVESGPTVYVVERGAIMRFADSIADPNPLYRDEDYAKKTKYGGIIAPPGFFGIPVNLSERRVMIQSPFTRVFNGGNEYEYLRPIRAGETLYAYAKLADLHERQGRPGIGRMLIQVSETVFKDEKGEVVLKARGTGISYEGATS